VKVIAASAKVSYANVLTQSSRNLTIQFLSQQQSSIWLGSMVALFNRFDKASGEAQEMKEGALRIL